MRLLANRSKRPLNQTTERLKNLSLEINSANKELKNLKARSHRMKGKLTQVIIEKNNLELQSKELHLIYQNKISTLDSVEKARSSQMKTARKQEEDRVSLFHVLNGDGDEASEKKLKLGLLSGIMKGKTVTGEFVLFCCCCCCLKMICFGDCLLLP